MSLESWAVVTVTVVVVPSIAWLVREVLKLRGDMIKLQTRLDNTDTQVARHQKWAGDLQNAVGRVDRNVARLCQAAGVKEETS